MEFSCLHTHTSFCDGKGEIDDFCRAAVEKGFRSLGFSAHAPIEKKTGIKSDCNLKDDRLEEYVEAVRTAKKKWEGRLAVYLGLEADFIPGLIAPWDEDFMNLGLDYVIGSVHFILPRHGAPFTVDDSVEVVESGLRDGFGGDREAMVKAYWDSVEAMINGGCFDILGHVDLVKKNNSSLNLFAESGESYSRRCGLIAGMVSKRRLIVEINTGGINRGKISDPYPSLAMLKAFCEKEAPVIINADAHKPEDLDGHYNEAVNALKSAGYKETVLFEGRKEGRPRWKPVKIK
jgi:histidinol-phosphatase (PHP family)